MQEPTYLLDTNIASYLIKNNNPSLQEHLKNVPMASICISAITKAELLHGVAKKPKATKLKTLVNEFLLRVETLTWDSSCAESYAKLKTSCENFGKSLGAMDMLIASHAASIGAVLVTNDKAFLQLKKLLQLEDWTKSTLH